jgi:hypothetical protein
LNECRSGSLQKQNCRPARGFQVSTGWNCALVHAFTLASGVKQTENDGSSIVVVSAAAAVFVVPTRVRMCDGIREHDSKVHREGQRDAAEGDGSPRERDPEKGGGQLTASTVTPCCVTQHK